MDNLQEDGQILFQLFNEQQLGRQQEIQQSAMLVPKCSLPSTMRLQASSFPDALERKFNYTVPNTDLYTLQMVHCRTGGFTLSVSTYRTLEGLQSIWCGPTTSCFD